MKENVSGCFSEHSVEQIGIGAWCNSLLLVTFTKIKSSSHFTCILTA